MKYLFISICIVLVLWACSSSEGDYPTEGVNSVQEQTDYTTEEPSQVIKTVKEQAKGVLVGALKFYEEAKQEATQALEDSQREQAQE